MLLTPKVLASTTYYEPPKLTIGELIDSKATEYSVSADLLRLMIKDESHSNPLAVGDTSYVCRRTGEISPSYGLVQINLCWHPEVSKEQAYDPEFAIDFLAKSISEGHCLWWSTCPVHKPLAS